MRAKEFLQEAFKQFNARMLLEGGNLRLPSGDEAGQIDLKVHDRKFIVPVLNNLLYNINNSYTSTFKSPLWSPELLKNRKFLSGSSLHFFNTDLSDEEFLRVKPKVGDIDTQIDKNSKEQVSSWLANLVNKSVGNAKFLGFESGNEQYSTLWELTNPPIKVQIDLEFVEYDQGEPTAWSQFSHSSDWQDLSAGIKGVFHKYLMRAFTTNTLKKRYVQTKTGKIQDKPVVSTDIAFAVASGKGGGMRQKYEPALDTRTGQPLVKDGLSVYKEIPVAQSEYINDVDKMFEMIFGRRPKGDDAKKLWSFTGGVELANKYLDNDAKEKLGKGFIFTLYGPAAQGLYRNDPNRDRQEKQIALDYMINALGLPEEISKQARDDAEHYYSKYKTSEGVTESTEEVMATPRQGIAHLQKMNDIEFINFVRSMKNDLQGRLNNVSMHLKIDGLGARFGKDKNGRPYFESSHSGPIFVGGMFSRHAENKGFTGEKLERARHYDNIFYSITQSDFVENLPNDSKVACEILYNPMAEVTDVGLKFVSVAYDKKALGRLMSIIPFEVTIASTGDPHPDSEKIIRQLYKSSTNSVKFIDNTLTQEGDIDINAIIDPVLSLNEKSIAILQSKLKTDREEKQQVKAFIQAVKEELADFIINHPGILGKQKLGKDIEGMVIKPQGSSPFKVTTPDFKAKLANKMQSKKQNTQNPA